jgi:hypothetical protein
MNHIITTHLGLIISHSHCVICNLCYTATTKLGNIRPGCYAISATMILATMED